MVGMHRLIRSVAAGTNEWSPIDRRIGDLPFIILNYPDTQPHPKKVRREEDAIFNPDRWESEEDMADRGHYFLWWLSQRPERTVAVVSHGTFLVTFFEKGEYVGERGYLCLCCVVACVL